MGPPGKSTHGLGQRVPGGGARDVYSSGQRRWLGGAGDCDGKHQRISRTGHGHRTFQRAVRASNHHGDGSLLGRVGAAVVTISNSSPQLGYGPQRLGFEGDDSVISKHQAVGASYFSQAWAVTTAAAITSQPAVVDGVAYFGDSGGVFHAVTVSDAKSSWTDSIGSGFSSSPAVDGGGGLPSATRLEPFWRSTPRPDPVNGPDRSGAASRRPRRSVEGLSSSLLRRGSTR